MVRLAPGHPVVPRQEAAQQRHRLRRPVGEQRMRRARHHAMVRAYNDFLSEFCAHDPSRLGGAALLPNRGVKECLEELERLQDMPGFVTWQLKCYPHGDTTIADEDDALWEAVEASGKPLTIHIGLSQALPGPIPARKLPGMATLLRRTINSLSSTLCRAQRVGMPSGDGQQTYRASRPARATRALGLLSKDRVSSRVDFVSEGRDRQLDGRVEARGRDHREAREQLVVTGVGAAGDHRPTVLEPDPGPGGAPVQAGAAIRPIRQCGALLRTG